MNDPLFKTLKDPLNAEEEALLTRRLSEAYCQTEKVCEEDAFLRIRQKVLKLLMQHNSGAVTGEKHTAGY